MAKIDDRKAELQDLTEQLRRDAGSVREAYRRLRADEDVAWTRYVADVDVTLRNMEHDLEAERDALATERAEQRDELRDALQELLTRVRAGLDQLRVQEALLEMDARDQFGELLDTGQHAFADLRAKVNRALDVIAFVVR